MEPGSQAARQPGSQACMSCTQAVRLSGCWFTSRLASQQAREQARRLAEVEAMKSVWALSASMGYLKLLGFVNLVDIILAF